MFEDTGRAVQTHLLNLDNYHREEIYARVDQITNPHNLLHDIHEAHCRTLVE